MKKKTILTVTIISTFLSLIFILAAYYGIDRYGEMYFREPSYFIEKYSKLPKAKDGRVVITVATTPKGILKMSPMINSILDQTVKVDLITLITKSGEKYKIPEYIKDVVVILEAGKDYGEATNLVPVLLREKECNTTIISLKDDVVYGKDFVEVMIDESKKRPDSVIVDSKNSAILVKPEHFGCDIIDRDLKSYSYKWFEKNAKEHYILKYSENYKLL